MLLPSIFGENLFDDDWMNFNLTEISGEQGMHFTVNTQRT